MKLRLLRTGHSTGAMNMAIDEAVVQHVSSGKSPPTIRFYGWKPACITIGYFQSMKDEVDVAKCAELGVDNIRRITGGGAVLHEHEVTYSIIVPEGDFSADILESYKEICAGIIRGLGKLDLEAQFVPLNDIIVNGRKISGNAQTRREHCILQHGTILVDVDVKKMFSLLLIPNEKIRDKMIENVEDRVTSVNKETGKGLSFDDVMQSLVDGFAEIIVVEEGILSESELEMAKKLADTKYSTESWNYKR